MRQAYIVGTRNANGYETEEAVEEVEESSGGGRALRRSRRYVNRE